MGKQLGGKCSNCGAILWFYWSHLCPVCNSSTTFYAAEREFHGWRSDGRSEIELPGGQTFGWSVDDGHTAYPPPVIPENFTTGNWTTGNDEIPPGTFHGGDEASVDYCMHCRSLELTPYIAEGGLSVLFCQNCKRVLCPYCGYKLHTRYDDHKDAYCDKCRRLL